MLDMLNGMEQVLTGSDEFDQTLYQSIVSCLERTDPNLVIAQESLWNGMLEYANLGGTSEDPWMPCVSFIWGTGLTLTTWALIKMLFFDVKLQYFSPIVASNIFLESC